MKMTTFILAAAVSLGALSAPTLAAQPGATALYLERTVILDAVLEDPTDLWVSPADLTRINDFVLKPEGACLDDLCVPIRQDEDSAIFVHRESQAWVNVTELADRLEQAWVADPETRVWSFGLVPPVRTTFFEGALAPDFSLPDREGNLVRLSDFRGKKVMLLTWASW